MTARRLRRLLFPPTKAMPGEGRPDPGHDLRVLALLAVLAVAGPVGEQLAHGGIQGCAVAFAGVGFGCQPWTPPPGYHIEVIHGAPLLVGPPRQK